MQKELNYNIELYHEGIKGQKWGVRNGPPYPLSKQEHDAVVKKKEYASYRKHEDVESLKKLAPSAAIMIGANAALLSMGYIAPLALGSAAITTLCAAGKAASATYWDMNEGVQISKLKKDERTKMRS